MENGLLQKHDNESEENKKQKKNCWISISVWVNEFVEYRNKTITTEQERNED